MTLQCGAYPFDGRQEADFIGPELMIGMFQIRLKQAQCFGNAGGIRAWFTRKCPDKVQLRNRAGRPPVPIILVEPREGLLVKLMLWPDQRNKNIYVQEID